MAGDDAAGLIVSAADVAPTLTGAGNATGGDRPPGTQVETAESLIVMSSGQANAEVSENGIAPALTCLHETQIIAFDTTQITHPPLIAFDYKRNASDSAAEELSPTTKGRSEGHIAVAFKPSHYTRGKDGAPSEIAPPLCADADKGDQDPIVFESRHFTRGMGPPPSEVAPALKVHASDGPGDAEPLVFESRVARNGRGMPEPVCPPLKAQSGENGTGDAAPLVMIGVDLYNGAINGDVSSSLRAGNGNAMGGVPSTMRAMQVRRLTPMECERLQGFRDGYTLITNRRKPAADGPRYKALGNSMAVPVMAWIGERIQLVQDIIDAEPAK